MMNTYYVGHPLQTRGAEEYRLQGGKGDGMRYFYIRNGRGLELWIAADRCADLARVTYRGQNMGYFSPCGHVAPAYYDSDGMGFLKSFTAGFFTTAGLQGVGGPSEDGGESVPQHGSIANTPAESVGVEETDAGITVHAVVRDSRLFGRRLVLRRTYFVSYTADTVTVTDTVTNEGETESPCLILYHCNMGYPLMSETSTVQIPHRRIWAKRPDAMEHIGTALQLEPPQQGYAERCYFFEPLPGNGVHAGVFSPDAGVGVLFRYDTAQLPCLTEWKMMGRRDYVLGIEPGNCIPCPRDEMRREGTLITLAPDAAQTTQITFEFTASREDFDAAF